MPKDCLVVWRKTHIHIRIECAAAAAKSLQSCPTLCDPLDSTSPGSPIHGIFWARVLELGAIAFSELNKQGGNIQP